MDPGGASSIWWHKIFFGSMMASLFIDPLFFFALRVRSGSELCIENETSLDTTFIILRSFNDVFYWFHIYLQFKTANMASSSRVFGRGEHILHSRKIASTYLSKSFWLDLLAALPIPQVLVWAVIPNVRASINWDPKIALRFLILFPYFYRLCRMYPLSLQGMNATGAVSETVWLRAAHDLLLFYVASHVTAICPVLLAGTPLASINQIIFLLYLGSKISGACWYLFTIERQEACWKSVCEQERQSCGYHLFDCSMAKHLSRKSWLASSNVTILCDPNNDSYQFGIYALGITTGASSSPFLYKYSYALWVGLQSICVTGQNLITSIYISENIYSIIVGTLGLLLMASLIANMQRYLLTVTAQLEEWRLKRNDIEEWMHHRQLPPELKQHVQRYIRHKWLATRGVDEKSLLSAFPTDLQREIKRHLCLNHVRQVPVFDQMDEMTLDVICERLEPALYTKGTFLIREGDPVSEIFFIIRGHLDSYTTDGGRRGFFDSSKIIPGGFCGEELLIWVLDQNPSDSLPLSSQTVKALSDVETFSLSADDLKFVVLQFHTLRSRKLRNKFKFYSQQWRTWAAYYIQSAWRSYKKRRKAVISYHPSECSSGQSGSEEGCEIDTFFPRPDAGIEVYAARLINNIRREKSKQPVSVVDSDGASSVESGNSVRM